MGFAKHATNAGGAVDVRDSSGAKERMNIAILQRKWPGVFRMNGKRNDEVVMSWASRSEAKSGPSRKSTGLVKKLAMKVSVGARAQRSATSFPLTAVVQYTKKDCAAEYITRRCRRLHGHTVKECLSMRFP